MTVYNYAQLEGLWINAGGPASAAPMAAAIALAESSGNSASMNYTDNGGTQTSVGLWQVSNGTHNFPASWTTPEGNASEAVAKYRGAGNSWSPWGTYTSGAYKRFLSGSATPDLNAGAGGSAQQAGFLTPGGLPDTCLIGVGGIGFGVGNTPPICFFQKSWLRALMGGGLMVLGGGVALVGVIQLLKATMGDIPQGLPAPAVKTAQSPALNYQGGTGETVTGGGSVGSVGVAAPKPQPKSKPGTSQQDAIAALRKRGNQLAPRQNPNKSLTLADAIKVAAA